MERLFLEPGWVTGTECPFLLQLEDDIVAKPNYLSTMKNFALQQPSEEWMILEFSQLGFIGNVLPCSPQSHQAWTHVTAGSCRHLCSWSKELSHKIVKYLDLIPPYFCSDPCVCTPQVLLILFININLVTGPANSQTA